jgi:hypothetical protein
MLAFKGIVRSVGGVMPHQIFANILAIPHMVMDLNRSVFIIGLLYGSPMKESLRSLRSNFTNRAPQKPIRVFSVISAI